MGFGSTDLQTALANGRFVSVNRVTVHPGFVSSTLGKSFVLAQASSLLHTVFDVLDGLLRLAPTVEDVLAVRFLLGRLFS